MLPLLKSAGAQLAVILDRGLTAAKALDRACRTHPDRPFFHLDAPLPYQRLRGTSISCRQLRSFANRVSNALKLAGLQRHDRVAVFKTNAPDYFFLALAIIRAGGIAVPINPGMRLADLQFYLNYTGATFLITDRDLYEERILAPGNCPGIAAWIF